MSISTKHEFVLFTHRSLAECESPSPIVDNTQNEWTMWLESRNFRLSSSARLQLHSVVTNEDYEQMFRLRMKVEEAFGITDEITVRSFIKDIQEMARRHKGQWYLARFEDDFIGEIGIVPFEFEGRSVGRLKDVDIVPEFQGKGFGNELLAAVCLEASKNELEALCLMADAGDWPKNWYLKFGFEKVGVVKKDDSASSHHPADTRNSELPRS